VHEFGMRRALGLAIEAAGRGEVPVGAVVVDAGGVIVGEGANKREELGDPTAHAEMIALQAAARHLGDWRLEGHHLYVTLEPCAMCAGAIVLARVSTVIFGARDPKGGMCGSIENLVQDSRLNHRVDVVEGVLRDECAAVLSNFFRALRNPE
jgi:tRNA(adenine34) deaminase